MANQNQNGRKVALPDENRPSWRPQDQRARGRGMEEERGRSWREGDERDDEGLVGERGERGRGGARESRLGSSWEDERDEGYRTSERYGQGQSGYTAGRYGEDRSIQGYQNRNQVYADRYEERQPGIGVDDRFSGRGGQGYWLDRGYSGERGYGGDRGYGGERPYGGERGFGEHGYGAERGYGAEAYDSGYNQGGGRNVGSYGQPGGQQGFGGHGTAEQLAGRGAVGLERSGYSQQGPGQGRVGGYGAAGAGGRSGQWSAGHPGSEYTGYGQPGYGQPGQGEPPRGMHRGKGPLGYRRSDERIHELVCEALTEDDQVDASSIEVTVKNGEVTLSGAVPDRRTKRLAEDCVERIAGVKDVQNHLKVQAEPMQSGQVRGAQVGSGGAGKGEAEPRGDDKKHRA